MCSNVYEYLNIILQRFSLIDYKDDVHVVTLSDEKKPM
jgi:hypothetical protein